MNLEIRPLTGTLGAEIAGLDAADTLQEEDIRAIETALYTHKVIFLRDQELTPEEHIEFSGRFGSIFTDHPPYLPTHDVHKEIVVLNGQSGGRADLWHSDISISPVPPMGSVLYMQQSPEFGGDTMWADMTAAYDALSDRMKTYLEGLTAVHDLVAQLRAVTRQRSIEIEAPSGKMPSPAQLPTAVHPVIRTHPATGKKILYVNPTFTSHIQGVPPAEADAILAFLYQHQNQPEFQCRWRWRQGDLAFWDNRATHHYAIADYGDLPRTIHRVTIEGEAPH